MSIREQLAEDLKAAMRAKDTVRVETIRGVRAAITQQDVDTGGDLDEAAILEVVRKLRKQRLESIDQYIEGGRQDLADRETLEKELLEAYLPAAPDAAVVDQVVSDVITAQGASSMRDMGAVMQAARTRLSGVDGKLLSDVVKSKLKG
jgi:uncharacterized protein YqeY